MHDRYPGYDVLSKRNTPSWNEQTRDVVDRRLAIGPDDHAFCTEAEWRCLNAVCDRIVPQQRDRATAIPVAALVDHKLQKGTGDGYRNVRLPELRTAWRRGLAAIDAEAVAAYGAAFAELDASQQDDLLKKMQAGELASPSWEGMPSGLFFRSRLTHDIVTAYYGHPTAWSEIGYGGPASPRGYVRMDLNRRDPWEAAEAKPGREAEAMKENARVAR